MNRGTWVCVICGCLCQWTFYTQEIIIIIIKQENDYSDVRQL